MSPKSLIQRTLTTLLDLFRASRDVVAAIIRPIGPLIRIFHHDPLNALLGFPANLCADRVFSYHDSDVTPGTPDDAILERQFERFNVGTSYFAERYRDRLLRSLSVDDHVGIDNRFYRCESSGWTRVLAPC